MLVGGLAYLGIERVAQTSARGQAVPAAAEGSS